MGIENDTEFEALCARLLPKFNEYLQRHSKNIFSCELATSLDGISTMPALYSKDGVQKQVIAPLSLLTKDVDIRIEEAKQATEEANTAAGKANDAAASVNKATTDLTAERKKVEDAVSASKSQTEAAASQAALAETKAAEADAASKRADAKIAQMDGLAAQITTGFIAPARMNLTYLPEISLRNKVAQRIAVQILPSYLPQSVLFQRAEGDSLVADPSGNLIIKGEGTTKFWVIPTANTPLWQEVSITVRQPRLRLSASGKLRKVGDKLRIV